MRGIPSVRQLFYLNRRYLHESDEFYDALLEKIRHSNMFMPYKNEIFEEFHDNSEDEEELLFMQGGKIRHRKKQSKGMTVADVRSEFSSDIRELVHQV